jgi:hypothetical protein
MANSVKEEEFISLTDAAKELNVTKFTLRELLYRENGLIDAFKIDKELKMRKSDFLKVKPKILELLKSESGK